MIREVRFRQRGNRALRRNTQRRTCPLAFIVDYATIEGNLGLDSPRLASLALGPEEALC